MSWQLRIWNDLPQCDRLRSRSTSDSGPTTTHSRRDDDTRNEPRHLRQSRADDRVGYRREQGHRVRDRPGLGRLGWKVGIGARDDQRREAAVEKLRAEGLNAFGVALDVTDDASAATAAEMLAEHGGLDVLVNNAGIFGAGSQVPSTADLATIRTVVETNVIGVFA